MFEEGALGVSNLCACRACLFFGSVVVANSSVLPYYCVCEGTYHMLGDVHILVRRRGAYAYSAINMPLIYNIWYHIHWPPKYPALRPFFLPSLGKSYAFFRFFFLMYPPLTAGHTASTGAEQRHAMHVTDYTNMRTYSACSRYT